LQGGPLAPSCRVTFGGGVPINAGNEIVGAIGVSGSPRSIHDEECADAGIAKIASSLK
jgi:uncharacterized protein GlcG (DUF336 family)